MLEFFGGFMFALLPTVAFIVGASAGHTGRLEARREWVKKFGCSRCKDESAARGD